MSQALWDWAVAAYARPGAADIALGLQDGMDQNVPLLLWAAWTAATGRPLDQDTVEAAVDTARAWDGAAVLPLRAVRRTLKKPIPDIDEAARLDLRQRVKALELEAERRLLEGLEALSPPPGPAPLDMVAALAAAARAWTRVVPRAELQRLAAALSS